jgi:hypothetical protein
LFRVELGAYFGGNKNVDADVGAWFENAGWDLGPDYVIAGRGEPVGPGGYDGDDLDAIDGAGHGWAFAVALFLFFVESFFDVAAYGLGGLFDVEDRATAIELDFGDFLGGFGCGLFEEAFVSAFVDGVLDFELVLKVV